jgi:SH3 domain protein
LKATVGEAKDVTGESDRLRAENDRLAEEIKNLEGDLERGERKEIIHWFLAGASVLLIGWLIGRISRQKRFY